MATERTETIVQNAPTAAGSRMFGHVRAFRRDPLRFLTDGRARYGDIVRFEFPGDPTYLVSHPDFVKRVFQDNHKNYSKDTPGFAALRVIVGNGLLTSEGSFWLRQRRIAQPAFHRERINKFGEVMSRRTNELVDLWKSQLIGRTVDVAAEMSRLTLGIVSETLFGLKIPDSQADALGQAVSVSSACVNLRVRRLFNPPLHWPTPDNIRFRHALAQINGIVVSTIQKKRNEPRGDDLLSLLMEAKDDDGESMSDAQLKDEVNTLYAAGHDTTTGALSWTFYLLAKHPEILRELEREVDGVLQGRLATAQDVPKLAFTKAVIQESMRLYPPGWLLTRRALDRDRFRNFEVERGSVVLLSPYVVHRHPDFWPEPDQFDPRRFLDAAGRERSASAYLPFGLGPRLCIGAAFAMQQMQIAVATVVANVRLHLVRNVALPEPVVTLRPRGGLPMRIEARR